MTHDTECEWAARGGERYADEPACGCAERALALAREEIERLTIIADSMAQEHAIWKEAAQHQGDVANALRAQVARLVEATRMMLAEAKNDVTGEYSSPAIRALQAALASLPSPERQ